MKSAHFFALAVLVAAMLPLAAIARYRRQR